MVTAFFLSDQSYFRNDPFSSDLLPQELPALMEGHSDESVKDSNRNSVSCVTPAMVNDMIPVVEELPGEDKEKDAL